MTTPQNPDGEQNPYGGPSGEQPPPPPQNPYGTPAGDQPPAYGQQPPAYGQQPPAYGQPPAGEQPPAQGQPPAYGQPPAPYGAPQQPGQPGQFSYGQPPAYGAPGSTNDAPKGMAITALVLSFLGCTGILAIVSIIMSVVVLRRGKDGRNHGKGLAIAAIIISVISLVVGALIAVGVVAAVNSIVEVDDLETGQCVTADGLSDTTAKMVTDIQVVDCSDSHDGEVLTTTTLSAEQAQNFTTDPSISACADAITAAGKSDLISDSVNFTALAEEQPEAGDRVACIAFNTDGSSMTGKLGG